MAHLLTRAGSRWLVPVGVLSLATGLSWTKPVSAQSVRGALLGDVSDSQGVLVPGLALTATELQRSIVRSTATDSRGHFGQITGMSSAYSRCLVRFGMRVLF
jgi:hypothetical protein